MKRLKMLEKQLPILLGLAWIVGCSSDRSAQPASGPQGLLWIQVQGLRADTAERPEFAAFAELRARSRVFEDVTTPVPSVRPASVSAMTGVAPDRHAVRSEVFDRLGSDLPTVAEAMGASGRRTLGVSGSIATSYLSGLSRGFETFDGPEAMAVGPEAYLPAPVPAESQADSFEIWLETLQPDERWFAWIDFAEPFEAPHSKVMVDPSEPYLEAVAKVDAALGRVLAALGERRSDTVIVLTSTSGMKLEEDGAVGAAYWLDEETLRIPAWIAAPGTAAGVDDRPATLLDLHATVVALAGLEPFGEGTSVWNASAVPGPRRAWTWAPDDEFAWPTLTAWDGGEGWVVADSDELDGDRPERVGAEAWAALRERPAVPREHALSETALARLAEAGVSLGTEAKGERPSGEDRAAILRHVQIVRHAARVGRSIRMQRRSRRALEAGPNNFGALVTRAYLALSAGAHDQAERLTGTLRERWPRRVDTLHWTAHVALAREESERAEALLRAALEQTPRDADLRYDLACLASRNGRLDEAREHLEEAIAGGFRNWNWLERDADLAAFRADPAYAALLRSHGR